MIWGNRSFSPSVYISLHVKGRYKNNNILVPKINKTIGQRSFIFLGLRMMNRLPKLIKNAENERKFRILMKIYSSEMDRKVIKNLKEMNKDER